MTQTTVRQANILAAALGVLEAAEAAKEGYRSQAQEQMFYRRLILACWVATGVCAVIGATLSNNLGTGFGVAAVWFFITGALLFITRIS